MNNVEKIRNLKSNLEIPKTMLRCLSVAASRCCNKCISLGPQPTCVFPPGSQNQSSSGSMASQSNGSVDAPITSQNLLVVLINRLQLSSRPSPPLSVLPVARAISAASRRRRLLRSVSWLRHGSSASVGDAASLLLLLLLLRSPSSPYHVTVGARRCLVASNNVADDDDEANVFVQRSHGVTFPRHHYRYPRQRTRAETRWASFDHRLLYFFVRVNIAC